ncbi:HD domain-containing protein [Oceanotoga sp. DSM 15011]|jgi:uncharacterized protein|uniref:HD domain-containing protein n=1 Tax=Oceanotoga teriensis TaxID=515440 RepID=A0AA45C6B0_9BACT|nr:MULTISPECIES: HD domain-containing protein [Oceanotoga]MDN5343768.1 uncharacterized protein [Oceanotoga sp.]MDO7975991.1 HD domain-containing protein [Oceanotoga teriensis]PWJ92029.1 uncharacterized protein C7380_11022 [Oceanotoga teriensis]UYO99019.1 HD domain-containing protein [Oceanotoga sp. DSM 15011]
MNDRVELSKGLALKKMEKFKFGLEKDKGFTYHHGIRVGKLALKLKNIIGIKDNLDELIEVGGIFHDIGKGSEPHNEFGAQITKEILKDLYSEDELNIIYDIVFYHNQRKKGNFPYYIKIIQDADMIDHYGVTGLWLDFSRVKDNGFSLNEFLEINDSEDNIQFHNNKVDLLNYDFSKKELETRIEIQRNIAKLFKRESCGDLLIDDFKNMGAIFNESL